jgi:hypothetical protein
MKKIVFIPDVVKELNVSAITTIPFMVNGRTEERTIGNHPKRITQAFSNIAFTFPDSKKQQMPPGLPGYLTAVESHLKVSSSKASPH